MYRLSHLLRRTSRKGCGGWSEPLLADTLNIGAGYKEVDPRSKQRWTEPAEYSWKADPLRVNDFASSSVKHGAGRAADAGRPPHAACVGAGGCGTKRKNLEHSYSGRTQTVDEAEARFKPYITGKSIADGRPRSIMEWIMRAVNEISEPYKGKSMLYDDDGQTKRAMVREDLKRVGDRFDVARYVNVEKDVLRGMKAIHSPSGEVCDCGILKGRLVGLLFFGETERSSAFMQKLRPFHSCNSEDFVVIAISLGAQEMMNLTRANGFYHCTRYNGAATVTSDVSVQVRHFSGLPQLFVLDGTTSHIITRGGVTAVSVNPDTCLKAWIRGEPGYTWTDLFRFGNV